MAEKLELPWIAAAFMCEKILQEPEHVYSAIRIIDVINIVQGAPPKGMTPEDAQAIGAGRVIEANALVMVRAGTVQGQHVMTARIENPEGSEQPLPYAVPVNFAMNDPAEAATIQIRLLMPAANKPGRYWIKFFWDDELLLKVPFRIKRVEAQSPEGQSAT